VRENFFNLKNNLNLSAIDPNDLPNDSDPLGQYARVVALKVEMLNFRKSKKFR